VDGGFDYFRGDCFGEVEEGGDDRYSLAPGPDVFDGAVYVLGDVEVSGFVFVVDFDRLRDGGGDG